MNRVNTLYVYGLSIFNLRLLDAPYLYAHKFIRKADPSCGSIVYQPCVCGFVCVCVCLCVCV